jgi:hypothetical protein
MFVATAIAPAVSLVSAQMRPIIVPTTSRATTAASPYKIRRVVMKPILFSRQGVSLIVSSGPRKTRMAFRCRHVESPRSVAGIKLAHSGEGPRQKAQPQPLRRRLRLRQRQSLPRVDARRDPQNEEEDVADEKRHDAHGYGGRDVDFLAPSTLTLLKKGAPRTASRIHA